LNTIYFPAQTMHVYHNFIFLHLFLFLELLVVQLKLLFCRWSLEKTLHKCWIKYRGQTYDKIIEQNSISQTCSCEQSLIKRRYRGDRYNTYVCFCHLQAIRRFLWYCITHSIFCYLQIMYSIKYIYILIRKSTIYCWQDKYFE
jgi:hypothetical protein